MFKIAFPPRHRIGAYLDRSWELTAGHLPIDGRTRQAGARQHLGHADEPVGGTRVNALYRAHSDDPPS